MSAVAGAVAVAGAGIMGAWNGAKDTDRHPPEPDVELTFDRLKTLSDYEQMAVLDQLLIGRYEVKQDNGNKAVIVNQDGKSVCLINRFEHFDEQLPFLRAYADLRMERMAEILAQITDISPFFSAIRSLNGPNREWSRLFLTAGMRMVARVEMLTKIYFSTPRPERFSDKVMPVIDTPTHSSYPSGHATEAFAYAIMLRALSTGNLGALVDAPDTLDDILFRQAFRIAENRIVAGVHFPVDSAAGFVLGTSVAEHFVAACGAGSNCKRKRWKLTGWRSSGAARNFTQQEAHDDLSDGSSTDIGFDQEADVILAPELLRKLFEAARSEWG